MKPLWVEETNLSYTPTIDETIGLTFNTSVDDFNIFSYTWAWIGEHRVAGIDGARLLASTQILNDLLRTYSRAVCHITFPASADKLIKIMIDDKVK